MAIGTNEANPSSNSISTQNSGINMFVTTSTMDISHGQKTAIVVVLFVYSILSNVEIRLRNHNPTGRTIAEICRYLTGIVASILVASIWVRIILWIGLAIWVALLALEGYLLYGEFHEQLSNVFSRIADVLIWKPAEALRWLGQWTWNKLLGIVGKLRR